MGPDPYKRRSCLLPHACSSFFYSLTSGGTSAGIIIILISYFNFNFPLHLHLHLYLRCRQKARTAGKEAEDWFTEYLNKKDVDPDKRYGTTPPVFSTLTRAVHWLPGVGWGPWLPPSVVFSGLEVSNQPRLC